MFWMVLKSLWKYLRARPGACWLCLVALVCPFPSPSELRSSRASPCAQKATAAAPKRIPLAHGRYWFLTMERPSWRRRPSKSWSLLSIIEYPTCRMGKCSCHFWLDLQMDRLECQLWVQKNWPTTLSASILSIKVHTILLCLDCWFWWSILTIPRLKWVSRSDIICRFF